jgi:hypothetical protein
MKLTRTDKTSFPISFKAMVINERMYRDSIAAMDVIDKEGKARSFYVMSMLPNGVSLLWDNYEMKFFVGQTIYPKKMQP